MLQIGHNTSRTLRGSHLANGFGDTEIEMIPAAPRECLVDIGILVMNAVFVGDDETGRPTSVT
jgi:hypothetical protein